MLSVVIPTHNRAESVARSLLALDAQECSTQFEVILAVDGCSDNTEERVRALSLRYPVTQICLPGLGAAAARNAGAADACGELLLFMDDDIVPQPGMLSAHLRRHDPSSRRAIVGPCPYGPEMQVNPIDFFVRDWWRKRYEILSNPGHVFTFYDCMTGNLSIPKHVFESVGGFDQAFLKDGREDYELGIRLIKSGIELGYAPDAVGYHYPTNRPIPLLNKWFVFGRADVYFARKHPEVLESSPLRRYWSLPAVKRRSLLTAMAPLCRHPGPIISRLGMFFERRLDHLWDHRLLGCWNLCQQMAYLLGALSTGSDFRELEHLCHDIGLCEPARSASRVESIDLSASLPEIGRTSGLDKVVLTPRLGDAILGWIEAECHAGEGSLSGTDVSERLVSEVSWDAWCRVSRPHGKAVTSRDDENAAWDRLQESIRAHGCPHEVRLSEIRRPGTTGSAGVSFLVFDGTHTEGMDPAISGSQTVLIGARGGDLRSRLRRALSETTGDYVALLKQSDRIDIGWVHTVERHFADRNVGCVITPVLLRSVESRGGELYQELAGLDRVKYWRSADISEQLTLAHVMYGFAACSHRMVFRRDTLEAIIDQLSRPCMDLDDLATAMIRETLRGYKGLVYEPRALMWRSSSLIPGDVRRMASKHSYLISREITTALRSPGPGRLRALRALSKVPRLQARKLIKSIRGRNGWPASFVVCEMLSGIRGGIEGLAPARVDDSDSTITTEKRGGVLWVL